MPCHMTMDSFGDTLPETWEDDLSTINQLIDDLIPELTDADGFVNEMKLRDIKEMLWEMYCEYGIDAIQILLDLRKEGADDVG